MIYAKVIEDSVNAQGNRLTTVEACYPRFIHAEVMTHRSFCLDGDSILEFDLPAGAKGGRFRRVHYMKLEEFVDKWINGARRYKSKPKDDFCLDWIDPEKWYEVPFVAVMFGDKNKSNINNMCRLGKLKARRAKDKKTWEVLGASLFKWRKSTPENSRFDMKEKLSNMRIRQLNEETGLIETSTVKNVQVSGLKDVYELSIGKFSIRASLDHLIYTPDGYKRLGDLKEGDLVATKKRGKLDRDVIDPVRLKRINGTWRTIFQRKIKLKLKRESPLCRQCGLQEATEAHHIVPVHQSLELAMDESNITILCRDCHRSEHKKQGWQGGTYTYAKYLPVKSITYVGKRMTYDLEIEGEFPNFLANGIVVHNSRNSASSRAIPVHKMLEQVATDVAMPVEFGSAKKGMQAGPPLEGETLEIAQQIWRDAASKAYQSASELVSLGVHKQVVNRILEPFLWHKVIISATEWDNFFLQRCSPLAQPEMNELACAIREAIKNSNPVRRADGWHTPYLLSEERELPLPLRLKISTARCARVSYLTHDGRRDNSEDVKMFDNKLIAADPPHWSPMEHVACPYNGVGEKNFKGWTQLRWFLEQGYPVLNTGE